MSQFFEILDNHFTTLDAKSDFTFLAIKFIPVAKIYFVSKNFS